MKLSDVDFTELLPSFMKDDKFDVVFSEALSNKFQEISLDLKRVIIVGQTDYLNESELDQLAIDMNVFWYDNQAEISVKRQIIKDAPLVFSRLGTVWTVERVINQYLSNTELIEWFDYDGDPHYFKLLTNDIKILADDLTVFLNILEKVKRKSQWLEEIILQLRGRGQLYPGIGIIEKSTDTITFSA